MVLRAVEIAISAMVSLGQRGEAKRGSANKKSGADHEKISFLGVMPDFRGNSAIRFLNVV
jgi:hypothetical protein